MLSQVSPVSCYDHDYNNNNDDNDNENNNYNNNDKNNNNKIINLIGDTYCSLRSRLYHDRVLNDHNDHNDDGDNDDDHHDHDDEAILLTQLMMTRQLI